MIFIIYNNFTMGVIQSKKEGIIKKYQLKIDLKADLKKDLLELNNWSFQEIKRVYDSYSRKTDCPLIDFFTFHKIMPFTTQVSRGIFESYCDGDRYLNIFQFVSILILMSHNIYRKKLQLLFVIFDFHHLQNLRNRQLVLIFQSITNGFCRMTGQARPKFDYLNRYTIQRFIRVNTLQALQKVVTYRRLIEEVQGNNDTFDLFKRFDQEIYGYFTQDSYLFKVNQYKKYGSEDIQRIYRIIKKANSQSNFEEVQLGDKNRRFRLQNRKMACIKQLLQQKQLKSKGSSIMSLKSKSYSMSALAKTLPPLTLRQSKTKIIPSSQKKIDSLQSSSPTKQKNKKILLLNGKVTSKQDIFETIKYFKSLSANKNEIKPKQFFQGFQKKLFLKKQISSLFKYFDKKKKGQINLQDFLRVYYENITNNDIEIIKNWSYEYKNLHEADNFDLGDAPKKKQKKNVMELPKSTLQRMDEIFNSIDRDKKGYLTLQDLKQSYNTGFSIKELQDMIKEFGTGNRIYKPEFIKMTLPQQWTIQGTDYVGA